MSASRSPSLYVGLDVGGTKTLAYATTGDGPPTTHRGPGANLQRLGAEGTARALTDLLHTIQGAYRGARLRAVCAGIAGAGREDEQAVLRAHLLDMLLEDAPDHLLLVHDAEIALEGAFEGASGLIVIAGTGSVVLARTPEGERRRVGGWGYLLGDEGSGYALGRAGLRAVAAHMDGGPETSLRAMLAETHGLRDASALIHAVYRSDWPIQSVAPLVVTAAEEGDAVARTIVAAQSSELADQAALLVRKHPEIEPRCAFLGGLASEPAYRRYLLEALTDRLPDWTFQPPAQQPVGGALRLALKTDDA